MAKKKLNAFNDRNAKEITTEDVEGLLKMQKEAKDKANYEANKADYKAPKYNSLPTLDDTSKKVSTKAPSVSPEQPKTMNVGNKTFKVADNAKKTSVDSGKKLATGKKDEQTEYYNKQIEKRNNLKRSESSLGNYGWEGSLKSIRNKQIAKTDRELASTYVNDKANEQEVNNALAKWSNPNYKMSEFERKQAKAITKDYFKGSDKKATYRAKNGLGADAKAKGLSAINFADDLANGNEERYNLMNQLAAKSNKASAVAMGGVDALGTNTLAKALNNAIGDEETAKTIAQMEQNVQGLKNQSPLAYNAGYMGTKMGEYAMLNNALDSIPALSKTGQALNKLGGLPKDMLADLALDTAFEVGENAVNGESAGQIGIDTAKNIGANIVFNMLPELLGGALKSANPEMADDVVKNLSEALQKEDVPKVEPEIQNGIQVYRGYNRSDNPLERNLAKEKTLSDVLGKKIPGTEEPEMLPLKYYTESFEDAESYANHDKLFYDSLHESAKREMAGDAINGKIKMNNMSEAAKEAYIKNIMDETYRILTGREPIFGNGHVDTLTINPNNVLDITSLGDRTNTENVYNLLSEMTGLPHTLPNGQYGANLDDYLSLSGLGDEFNTYMLLRNLGKGGNYGKNFTGLMRDYGYDAVKYSEDGYNHYALLDDFDKSKVGTNEQLIARYNERIQKILDDINRRDVKEPYKWEEETLNDLENSIDYLLENESHIDANAVDTKTIPNLEDAIVEDVAKPMPNLEKPVVNEVAKEVEPQMTALDYDNAVRDLSERYSIANEVDDLVSDDLAKAISFDSDTDREAFEEVYNAFIEDSKNVMNGGSTREVAENMQKVYDDYKALDEVMRRGYVADSGSKKELQKIKKNFYNDTKGTVIRLTPELRHEMGLDGKTIAELNNEVRLGKNGIRFSANNGTPIDMLFDELKQASGNAMRDAENSADQINALMEYVESLKNGEGAKMRVDGRDLVDSDFWDSFEESAYAYGDELGKLGARPEGLENIAKEETPDNITSIFDEEPVARYMAEDTGIGRTTTEPTDIPRVEEGNLALSPYTNTEELADGTIKTQTGEIKERGYSDSIRNKTDLPDDVKNEFPDFYEVLKNKDTETAADNIMENSDTNGALAEAYKRIQNKDAVGIPLGYKVSKALIEEGRREDAVELLHYMSSELTRSGQFSQAAAITLMHEDPMTALRYLQKQMDEINVEGAKKYRKKWHDLELTEDEISRLGDLEMGDAEGIKEVFDDVFKRLQKEYPSTMWEKFVELTKLGMLLNPRTHIRNAVANSLLLPVRSASDRVSAVGQLLSGSERTQSLVGGTKAQKKIAGEVYENEMKGLLEGDDKWSDIKGVARDKQVFNDSLIGKGVGNVASKGLDKVEQLGNAISEMPLMNKLTGGKLADSLQELAKDGKEGMTDSIIENLRRFDYYLLSKVEDDPFVKKNFTNRLASYMKAQNINSIDEIPKEAKDLAWEEALKATFKDDNNFTEMLSTFKNKTGKFGEVLLPFTKTPANLAMRAIDYSPWGIKNAIADYYNTPITQRNVGKLWDDMSKGVVGTAGILLGYLLRKSGVITGALSEDTDTANFEKQQGKQAYSLHLGDKYYSYDWAQPAGTPMIIGANIYDAITAEDTSESGRLETIGNGLLQGSKAAVNTWMSLSPLQSLSELFNGNENSGETFADRALQTVVDMPQRLIPSLMGATARTVDPTMRETYDKTNLKNTWVNTAKAKIPAIGDDDNWWNTNVSSKSLPAKYDNWGNERTRSDSVGEAAFAQMVNPGQLSNNNSTPIDNEIGRLGELDAKAYPSTAKWSVKVGDTSKKLTNVEHSNYQKELGQAQYQLAKTFVGSDYYNNFSDDEKTEVLGNMYSFADALAKSKLFGYDIANNNNFKKAYAAYQDGGLDAVANYYASSNVLSEVAGQFKNKKGEEKNFSNLTKEENLKVLNDMVNQGYMTKEEAYDYLPDNKMVDTLSQYGNKGYELYADLVQYGTNDKGDFTSENVIPVLQQTNTDPEIAGAVMYALNGNSNSHKLNDVYKNLGNQGVWDYYNYKQYADFDGNGSLKKDEIVDYLNSRNMSDDERRYWFEILKSNAKTKNPY